MAEVSFNPGSAWVAPKLYRFDGYPEAWEITVLRPWPDPRAWRRSSEGSRWLGCRPSIDLSIADRDLPRRACRRRRLEHAAYQAVPESLRRLIGPFRHDLQWGLLSMAARVEGADELLAGNAGLGVGLAWSFRLRKAVKQPLRSARWLVRRPRRQIAGWLGFPPTQASVRTLARVEPQDCTVWALRHLANLVAAGERWVHHLPTLPTDVLLLIEPTVRPALTFGLLEEMAHASWRSRRRTAYDVRFVLAAAARLKPARRVPPLRSVGQVRQLAEELTEEERRQHILRWKAAGPFPDPPYAAQWMPQVLKDDRPVRVEPVADPEALLIHAEEQRNCLANDDEYLDRILDGTGYVYELSWEPTEGEDRNSSATLFVEGKGILHRHWGVHDMKLRCNDEAPEWLDGQVARFLARVPASRDPAAGEVATEEVDDRRQLALPFAGDWAGRLDDIDGFPF